MDYNVDNLAPSDLHYLSATLLLDESQMTLRVGTDSDYIDIDLGKLLLWLMYGPGWEILYTTALEKDLELRMDNFPFLKTLRRHNFTFGLDST